MGPDAIPHHANILHATIKINIVGQLMLAAACCLLVSAAAGRGRCLKRTSLIH